MPSSKVLGRLAIVSILAVIGLVISNMFRPRQPTPLPASLPKFSASAPGEGLLQQRDHHPGSDLQYRRSTC